jgi:hypothetical protein
MKKLFSILCLLAFLSLACRIQATVPTQQADKQPDVATIVAATLQAMVTPPPPAQPPSPLPASLAPPTQTSAPTFDGKSVTVGNISFVIPNGLATAASGAQIPAANEQNAAPWDVAPAHLEITLDGYPSQGSTFHPKIYIYPAQEYSTAHQGAAESIQRLQTILANPSSATKDNLPTVPFYNAAQMFAAQINTIKFQNGAGVRMVTAYGQAAGPITKDMTFYHFEGLTSDNKYYIIAILPIQSPSESIQFPGYNGNVASLDQYYNEVTTTLNSAAPSDFNPNLTKLDALIQSIQVTP